MAFYLSLILVVVVLGSLARRWKKSWQTANAGQPAIPNAKTVATMMADSAAMMTPLRERMTQEVMALRRHGFSFGDQQPDLAQRFRAWATAAPTQDENLNAWLNSLSPQANEAFTQQVAEFCNEMGFELAALVDGQLNQLPTTAQKAKEIVLHYCRANRQAAVAQEDFDAYKRFLTYLRAPSQKANQHFGQLLCVKLVQKELAPAPSFDILLATEEQRRAHTLAAIRQSAAQSPTAFNAVLKEIINAEATNTATTVAAATVGREKVTGLFKRATTFITPQAAAPTATASSATEQPQAVPVQPSLETA